MICWLAEQQGREVRQAINKQINILLFAIAQCYEQYFILIFSPTTHLLLSNHHRESTHGSMGMHVAQWSQSPSSKYYIIMQDYKILPTRKSRNSDASCKNWTHRKFYTNYYHLELNQKTPKVYQYDFKLPTHIPHDSQLYQETYDNLKKNLRERFGYLAHKGQQFWGGQSCSIPSVEKAKFTYNGQNIQHEVVIKKTKELDLSELDIPETRARYLQILNIELRNSLKSCGMMELGKMKQFYPRNQHGQKRPELDSIGLVILRGFQFTIVPLNVGICLQIDACSRILQKRSLLAFFNECRDEDMIRNKFEDTTVMTKYGNYRTFSIIKVEFGMKPTTLFFNQRRGVQQSYADYYRSAYNLKVQEMDQPLIKVIGRYKQVHEKNNEGRMCIKKVEEYIYLVPELVSPTGMTEQQRSQNDVMKKVACFTKLTPEERVHHCEHIKNSINETNGMVTVGKPLIAEGAILDLPKIQYDSEVRPSEKGIINNRGKLKEPFEFKDWLFVYSRKSLADEQEADSATKLLNTAGKTYGVSFKGPGFLEVDRDVQKWVKEIKKDVQKYEKPPQIIVFFLKREEQHYYNRLKKFTTNTLKVPSQVILRKTLNSSKNPMSAASKILIQMNIKVGAVPWEVKKSHKYFKNKRMMYGAISVSKGKGGFTLSFVGTINNECTKVYSQIVMGVQKKEQIPMETFEKIFINWARSFCQKNKGMAPEVIVIYREGQSDVQCCDQLPRNEIPALEEMIQKIGNKLKLQKYDPEIMILTVNKKISSRFFEMSSERSESFKIFNPTSGAVIMEWLAIDSSYEFHLVPQLVTQGTCTPTLFKVAYDKSNMPIEAIMTFTYEQCFNYYNWEGAVRVPACLQCANKMAKLFGEHIKEVPDKDNPLLKKHFFL